FPSLSTLACLISPTCVLSVNCQQLTAAKTEEFSSEGSSVTLTCSYTKDSANYLFWYRQNPGEPPEFLRSHSPFGGSEHLDRMTFKGSKEEMSMKISSAAVTDSAVYYCAVLSEADRKRSCCCCRRITDSEMYL
uniref:Ig-like domain-containing protein n=1 Tax=Xiphophorus maculatus TaxID=8083 RepID=A0A3B5QK10_XIPMA